MIKTPIYIENILSDEICKFAASSFRLHARALAYINPESVKEHGFDEKTWSLYCAPVTESLAEHLTPLVEKAVGKELWPTYSYGRVYGHGARLDRHADRRSSEYTVSLCVEKDSTPWNLVIETDNEPFSIDVQKGAAVIYSGRDYFHYRDGPFKGREQVQFFLQYVDKHGDSADLKWDTRPELGLPYEFTDPRVQEELFNQLTGL